jgi:hypothetical protein
MYYIEVATLNVSNRQQQNQYQLSYFLGQIRKINLPVVLDIRLRDQSKLDAQTSIGVSRQLAVWLRSEPQKGDKLEVGPAVFELIGENSRNQVGFIVGLPSFAVRPQRIGESIHTKVKKYEKLEAPLVVALVPDFYTHYDADDMADVVLGQETIEVDWDNQTSIAGRLADGLYTRPDRDISALSAIMWLPKRLGQYLPPHEVVIFPNPNAKYPIPLENFHARQSDGSSR